MSLKIKSIIEKLVELPKVSWVNHLQGPTLYWLKVKGIQLFKVGPCSASKVRPYANFRYNLRLAAGVAGGFLRTLLAAPAKCRTSLQTKRQGASLKRFRYNLRIAAGVALGLIFVLSPIVWLYTTKARETEAAWFNDSWLYRKAIAITNSSGSALTDFQVKALDDYDTSALVTAGKMQSDCDDIRFTDINGKLLPYWIESGCNTSTTDVWVKMPTVNGGSGNTTTTVYLYYGNPSATSYQNGNDTFEFFDDFNGSVIDQNKWALEEDSFPSLTNGYMDLGSGSPETGGLYLKNMDMSSYVFGGKFNVVTMAYPGWIYNRYQSGYYYDLYWESGNSLAEYKHSGSQWTRARTSTHYPNISSNTDYYWKMSVNGNSVNMKIGTTSDGSDKLNDNITLDAAYNHGSVGFECYYATAEMRVYYIFVRKYASTEPTAASPGSEEQSKGPVAYWKFDEGYGTVAQDSTTNNNDGNLGVGSSAPSWQTEDMCVSGKCLKFDGSDYIDAPDSNNWPNGTTFTISLWAKWNGTPGDTGLMGQSEGGGSTLKWALYWNAISANNFTFHFQNPAGTTKNVNWAWVPSGNNWYHISVVRNGSSWYLYINGVATGGTQTEATAVANVTDNLSIGKDGESWKYFNGFLDEVKIYPYARTASEIRSDFVRGAGSKGTAVQMGRSASNLDALSNGLVGYWKMDEASANTCTGGVNDSCDSSGNGKDGAWNGNVTSAAGKFGNGTTYDGTADSVSIANNNIINVSQGTVSLWVKPNSGSAANYFIFSHPQTSTNSRVYIVTNAAGTVLNGVLGSGTQIGSVNITTSTWHHVTLSWNGTRAKFFVDGTDSTTTSTFNGLTDTAATLYLGSWTGDQSLNGTIDDVRIYNRSLSAREVRDLYNWAPPPVAYYSFDEGSGGTVQDRSGNNNTGTWSGTGTTHWTTGKYGKAGKFNGTDDYVDAGSGASLNITNAITIEAWIYPKGWGGGTYGRIVDKGANAYIFMVDNTTVAGSLRLHASNGNVAGNSDANSITLNTWQYVVVSYDRQNIRFYINGVAKGVVSKTAALLITALNLRIGNSPETASREFNGLIDQVRIYNYARTPGQIVEDMNAGHPAPGSPVGSAVGYWKFDEGYGTTANNSGFGGSSLNGTLGTGSSAPSWSNSGKFGKALQFDGSNDYVDAGSASSLDTTGSDPISVSLWVNPSSLSTLVYYPISKGWNFGINGTYTECGGRDGAVFVYYDGQSTVCTESGSELSTGNWYHLAFTYTNNTLKIYVNGVKRAEQVSYSFGDNSSLSLFIGKRSVDGAWKFNGLIDEVKIYNSALTEDQVKQEYNQGKALVLGSFSDTSGLSGGSVASNSASAAYCIPGDTATCNSPVGEWKMDEKTGTSAYDTSGNGNTGTLGVGSSAPSWTSGKIGGALKFDGSNDYITVADSPNFDFTSTAIEGWFYPKSFTTSNKLIIRDDGSTNRFWQIQLSGTSGAVQFIGKAPTTWEYNITSTKNLTLNSWNHVAVTVNASSDTAYLYINGQQVGTDTASGDLVTGDRIVEIGGTSSGTPYTWNGLIDHVRIYNYARTAAQIAWDYNRGGPVGYWKFDECQGTTAYDSSGFGNNGNINIGATAPQTSAGTCTSGDSAHAWYNGATGKYNSSLSFDGTDDYVDLGTKTIWDLTTYSISGWFKTSDKSDYRVITSKNISSTNRNWWITIWSQADPVTFTPGSVVFRTSSGGVVNVNISSGQDHTDNQWHYFAAVLNGTTEAKLYVDGILKATQNNPGVPNTPSTSAIIGNGPEIAGRYFSGQIDDVRIYNYALTHEQVKLLYNQGSAVRFGPSTGSP